jgi:WXG100 family type VII secretion target
LRLGQESTDRNTQISRGLGAVSGKGDGEMSSANEMGQGQGTLTAAAGMVADAKHDFDRLNNELVQHIDAAKAKWAGQGGTAFNALGHAWSEKQRTIVNALNQFEASLRSTEKDNTSTDDTQSSAFSRNQQRLG